MPMRLTATTIFALAMATGAHAATLSLRAGDYGAADLACDHQPNATTMSFDGRNFSYPHASRCTDRIVKRTRGGVLTIAETCRAAGDGSPAPADTQRFRLRQQGVERFALIKDHGSVTFRRCGPIGYFNAH